MSRLVDIKSEKFWDVLFDEACVEGSQAERIENDLNKIAVSEQEIRNKAVDEFAERLKTDYVNFDMYYILQNNNFAFENTSLKSYQDMIDEIAKEIKGGAE